MELGMEIVVGAIVLLVVLLAVGYITKKKYYKEIDRLEARKLNLMNRPVLDEMAKIKQLNMTGQTEELFERWRQEWDDIVTVQLPNVDEMLFDAEEYADRYRFQTAKKVHAEIESTLDHVEQQIDSILQELSELIGSEEKNRLEIAGLLEKYKEAKKNILAHRHNYGESSQRLEELLDSTSEKLTQYEDLTVHGNYLEAREVVLQLSAEMDSLLVKMEKIPDLLTEVQTIVPSQLDELAEGFKEMKETGFILDHLQMDKELARLRDEVKTYASFLKNAEAEEVESGIQEMKEKIDLLYDLLETEVHSKHYMVANQSGMEERLADLKKSNEGLKTETETVQSSYQLLENELETLQEFEKKLGQLEKRFDLLHTKAEEGQSAFSLLSEELKEIERQLTEVQTSQQTFSERLCSLRKDELDAREKIAALKKKINEIIRLVQKSKMPGIPNDFEMLYSLANEHIEDVYKSLKEKPLNMKSVQRRLLEAEDTVSHLFERTVEHIENAQLAEKIIQYGNRYRGRYQSVRSGLDSAEQAFRNYEYRSAMEQAATAVEEVEPGALQRIEEMMNTEDNN